MEDALIASIEPIIFLFLFNEFVGIPLRMRGGTGNSGRSHPTSLVRIGLVASFPLVVMTPPLAFGLIILFPTLAIFFVSYWASTDTPLSLKGNDSCEVVDAGESSLLQKIGNPRRLGFPCCAQRYDMALAILENELGGGC